MSDVQVNANRESALLTSLEKANVSDLYSYRLLANAPNGSRSILSVSPQIAPSANPVSENLTFRIPRYGKIQRMLIESTLTTAGDNSAVSNTDLGLRVFSDITLRAHSKLIASTNPSYNAVRKSASEKEMSDAMVEVTNSSTVFSATSITVYTPVPMWFQEKTSNYLDLQFVEQLELDLTVNTLAGMGLTEDLTGSSFKLFCFYRHLAPDAQRAYEAKNFSPQSPLNMLIYDQYTETTTITDDDTSTTIDLKVPHAIFATHVFARDTTDVGPDSAITALTVNMTGRPVLNAVPGDVFTYDGGFYKKGNAGRSAAGVHTYETAGQNVLSIYWSESADRTFNSHAVAAANINNFQVVATHADLGSTKHLVVVHEYWKICTVNPDDGRIDIGYSL